jgi:hypothetical protein
LWARINIKNPSADAERIGQSQLSAYCRAAGVMQLTDTAQLHNRPVRARVKIRPASDKYPESNEVTGFEAIGGPGTAPAVQAAQPAAAAAPAAVPPWQKARAA